MPVDRQHYFRLLDHTADLAMEICGGDARSLFVNAGRALFEVLVHRNKEASTGDRQHHLVAEGDDWEDLMVNWLREILFLWNGKGQILNRLEVLNISERALKARAVTVDFDPTVHRIEKEIKAVTYHRIEVTQREKRWCARVVFDV